jgi:uncharacterized membrane protein
MIVISITISTAATLIGAAASVATTGAVGPGRHRVPDPSDLQMAGFGVVALVLRGISFIVNLCVSSFFMGGIAKFSLKVARGEPYAFGDVFAGGQYFLSILVVYLLTYLAVGIGLVFLIVPGIIVAIGFSMAIPTIVDRSPGPIDALSESWKLTEGNRVNLFIFGLICFGLSIAGVCACGIGILLVAPILYIAWLYVYLKLTGQPVAALPSPAAQPMGPPPGYGAPAPR